MSSNLIFLPVLIELLIPIVLYAYLAVAKAQAIRNGQVNQERRALYEDAWPVKVQQINNSIKNQFQLPVLFYVLIFVFWAMNAINIYLLILAWLFVISRLAHAYVHVGSNYVPVRRNVFMFGWIMIFLMAVWATVRLILIILD